MKDFSNPFKNFRHDLPAGLVVFLVAVPLSLGIALASGAPLYSGLIAGFIGGVLVGTISNSPLGVSGPAAGLAVIVLNAITNLGSFEIFLVALVIAGIIQVILGFLRAGVIAYYFPSSVIHGMLAGIGILIILKQIPHAFGWDHDPEGDYSFFQPDGETTFSSLMKAFEHITPGAVVITLVSMAILLLWERDFIKKLSFTKLLPGPLIAVIASIILVDIFDGLSEFAIAPSHLVSIPVPESATDFLTNFTFPDFRNGLANIDVYNVAVIIAVVASIETLLSVEAIDKQDPYKRITSTNLELKAQGIGNILSGLIGGIPITQVIVRSSVNKQAGGRTKMSTIFHGFLIFASVVLFPELLNMIPLATLAAILILAGYKLSKPALYKSTYLQGKGQFLPFIVTIVAMLFTDLLIGITLGMVVAVVNILLNNYRIPYTLEQMVVGNRDKLKFILSEDVTFLNKASIRKALSMVPDNSCVEIDATNTKFIHFDILEILEDFKQNAEARNIKVTFVNLFKDKRDEPINHFKVM